MACIKPFGHKIDDMQTATLEDLKKTALLSALLVRKTDLEKRLKEIEGEIEALRKEHGSFDRFVKGMDDSLEAHDIWIKWSFLREAKKKIEEELRAIEAELSSLGYK